ncbi:AsmA family protein (plasmid) [Pseudorhodobacter turbinis]|uniref:AsmA family protein n=1 Tax=Pseudorhodobacter turbinis TaxID=2500533 RepID=A0A4P8EIM0_9RHOB|nr:AsmA family protein [Pseudorhodobacter turbinis]QCO56779.1 AsmA family protein [Pseudorhodobacter turbinis]
MDDPTPGHDGPRPDRCDFIGPPQPALLLERPRKPRLKPKSAVRPHRRGTFWLVPTLIFLSLAVVFVGLALTGKPIRLPVWMVVEAEQRMNTALQDLTREGTAISVGGAVFVVDTDWVPRLRLEDVRLLEKSGETAVSLPELRVALDPAALMSGQIRLRSLRLIGPRINLRRLEDGQFDLAFEVPRQPHQTIGLSGLIKTLVAVFDQPLLSHLRLIEAQALTFRIEDRMLDRVWDLGDGRLQLVNRGDELAVELGVSVTGDQAAQAVVTLIAAKADASARMTVTVDRVAAADIAVQAAPLAWLGVLDAPISGQIASTLDQQGALSSLDASLTLDKGALQPTPDTKPVAFEGASVFFGYDPARERLDLREWTVNSQDLALSASGHAYLPGVTTGIPQNILAQIQIDRLQLDPQDALEEAVVFDQGALDFRVRMNPFGIDIGQASLIQKGQRLQASGVVEAGPEGWSVAVDASLDHIARDGLLAVWPSRIVPKTRVWVADNVQEGQLSNLHAGFRSAPGAEPRFSLGYDFSGGNVRFLKTLPPIQNGRGYSVVEGKSYSMVIEEGAVTAPSGGEVDVAGSIFAVGDVTQKPARAHIGVKARGGLTAALSLLDQKPFEFMTKAKLPVDLGDGRVEVAGQIHMPLRKGVKIHDVDFDVAGAITAFSSDRLVPGRELRAERLVVGVTPAGMEITGKGALQDVPFEGRFSKVFTPEAKGISEVEGRAELSHSAAAKLNVNLPDGLLTGRGFADFVVDLHQGQAPKLTLRSDLAGVGMGIPALGWSKSQTSKGNLALDLTLGKPANVDSLSLDAAGLQVKGQIGLVDGGGMGVARLSSVRLDKWLDAQMELTGRGTGQTPAVVITGGMLDLRGLPARDGTGQAQASAPMTIALDQLVVTNGLSLSGFQTTITPKAGGVAGDFTGRVNGQTRIAGSLAPSLKGTAVRIRSNDAGSVFSAAKVFPNAEGGALDLILTPTGSKGSYDGSLKMQNIRIRKAPALAELINAISVVGLLDQLQSGGLLFDEAEAIFRLTPRTIQINRASAVGASLGVSLSGLYVLTGGRLDLQGVVSPIYLLNQIGSFFTRKGEGLFGFSYTIQGTAKIPEVSVNPLSILTPGMFREIFRSPPPQLEPTE